MPTISLSWTAKTKTPMAKMKAPDERRNKRADPRRIRGRHCTSSSIAVRAPAPASHAAPSQARKPELRASFARAGAVRHVATASSSVACVLRTNTASRLLSSGGSAFVPWRSMRRWKAYPQYTTTDQKDTKLKQSSRRSLRKHRGLSSKTSGHGSCCDSAGSSDAASDSGLRGAPSCSSKYSRSTCMSYRRARSSRSRMFSVAAMASRCPSHPQGGVGAASTIGPA
mmetsp:Transcript_997/g.2552  ORF Transcript_997/g.2552 Transcript_997/m.2552 type:complete len:226 (+) Transcript_997:558-1235(+)